MKESELSPIFLRIQTQLVRLLVGLLVGQLLPSFFILWYDLPTNSLTNYPTNNRISWVWMRRKMGHSGAISISLLPFEKCISSKDQIASECL
jgi:hypothetical protein